MRSRTLFIFIISFFLIVILFNSCTQPKSGWQGTIEKVNGVTIVKNPEEPLYGEFTFDLVEDLIIGGNVNDDNYYFQRGVMLAVDDQGNFYVTDIRYRHIQKYDSSGQYLKTIGRKGQGPGEFRSSPRPIFDGKGNFWTIDYSARALKFFTLDGAYLKSIKLQFPPQRIHVSREGFIFGFWSNSPTKDGFRTAVVKLNANGSQEEIIAEFPSDRKESKSGYVSHYYINHLSFCSINTSSFCYGYSSEYRIYIADGTGKTIRIIEKYEDSASISKREKKEIFKNGISSWSGQGPKKWEDLDFPSHRPFFWSIEADDIGRIYVLQAPSILEKSEIGEFDVFGRDGSYLYQMRLPIGRKLRHEIIKDGFVYMIREDEETGDITIIRYKIQNWDEMKAEKNPL